MPKEGEKNSPWLPFASNFHQHFWGWRRGRALLWESSGEDGGRLISASSGKAKPTLPLAMATGCVRLPGPHLSVKWSSWCQSQGGWKEVVREVLSVESIPVGAEAASGLRFIV